VAAQAQNAMKVRLEMLSWKRHRNDPVEHETDALIVASQLTFEAYLRAQGRYHMLPYGGNVTLFRAVRSGIAFRSAGPTLGWAPHVTGRLDAVPLDADHETIIESPAIDVIVRNLSDRLDAVAMERLGLPPPVGDRTGWDRFSPGRPGTWSPLVCLSKGDDGRTPLVCVHGAGGNVFWAQRLIEHLPPGTPVYGLQAYGIDGRQRPLRTIEEMAERYVGFLLHQLPGRRFALLGYSGGGTIAYEMTRQLRSKGKDAPLLAMIDTLCPTHEIWPRLSDWLRYGRRRGIRQMLDKARYGLIEVVGPVVHPFMKLRRSYRPPEPALALETELFRSFVAAQRRYRLEPLDTRIVLFRASDDGVQYSAAGPTLGWGGLVGDMVESFPLDANHTNIIDGTPMNVIAGEMARRLSAIEADIRIAEASAVSADITDEQRPITVDRKAESDASQFLR
jgi:thioesterase domain-containing protein